MAKIEFRAIAVSMFIGIFSLSAFGQLDPGMISQTERFKFYNNYWFNMHHFFQQEALSREVLKRSTLSDEYWNGIGTDQKQDLQKVITFYQKELISKDLRFNGYMDGFRKWLIRQSTEKPLTGFPSEFELHVAQLNMISDHYKQLLWPAHQKSNKSALDNQLELIKKTEKEVFERLAVLTKSRWSQDKIRVDISYFAKSTPINMKNRPYTALGPTHVIMNSIGFDDRPAGDWLELLFHEASHELIGSRTGFVGGTISDVGEALKSGPLRNLWHAYLFYLSGIAARDALRKQGIKDYELYMVRNGTFAYYFPFIDKYLGAYVERRMTLKDATLMINKEFLATLKK